MKSDAAGGCAVGELEAVRGPADDSDLSLFLSNERWAIGIVREPEKHETITRAGGEIGAVFRKIESGYFLEVAVELMRLRATRAVFSEAGPDGDDGAAAEGEPWEVGCAAGLPSEGFDFGLEALDEERGAFL